MTSRVRHGYGLATTSTVSPPGTASDERGPCSACFVRPRLALRHDSPRPLFRGALLRLALLYDVQYLSGRPRIHGLVQPTRTAHKSPTSHSASWSLKRRDTPLPGTSANMDIGRGLWMLLGSRGCRARPDRCIVISDSACLLPLSLLLEGAPHLSSWNGGARKPKGSVRPRHVPLWSPPSLRHLSKTATPRAPDQDKNTPLDWPENSIWGTICATIGPS